MATLTRSGVIPYNPGQFLYYFTKQDVPLESNRSACILKRRFVGSVRIVDIHNSKKNTRHTVFYELEGEKDMISENDIYDTYDKAIGDLIDYTGYMHPDIERIPADGGSNITASGKISLTATV